MTKSTVESRIKKTTKSLGLLSACLPFSAPTKPEAPVATQYSAGYTTLYTGEQETLYNVLSAVLDPKLMSLFHPSLVVELSNLQLEADAYDAYDSFFSVKKNKNKSKTALEAQAAKFKAKEEAYQVRLSAYADKLEAFLKDTIEKQEAKERAEYARLAAKYAVDREPNAR